jgi:hypothetical protein
MGIGVLGAVVVMAGGFTVARAMRFRRRIREDDERRQSEDLNRRRHHFRGSLDLELEQGPFRGPSIRRTATNLRRRPPRP